MPTLSTRQVRDALTRKGAEEHETHHLMFRRYVDGKLAATTRISHSEDEIGGPRIAAMARQCKLSRRDFEALVLCTLTVEQWDVFLRRSLAT